MTQRYPTPAAFRQALDQRLRTASADGHDFERRRQMLVFDRFLARIAATFGSHAVLKGGLGLELRLHQARTTKDVDLNLTGSQAAVSAQLHAAGLADLGDSMDFEVIADAKHPAITNPGMRYHGLRFRAKCRLAGRIYGQPFGVDVGFGDPMFGPPDEVTARDTLAFVGIAPPRMRLVPVVTHIAEKVHAYTQPRLVPNSRVKDLPDLALLASIGPLAADDLRAGFAQTFSYRGTHAVPLGLPAPPPAWSDPYAALARDDHLRWPDLATLVVAVRAFLDGVLAGTEHGRWDPGQWAWQ